MGTACYVLADEDFILSLLTNSSLRDKYQKYTFSDHVKVCMFALLTVQFLYSRLLCLKKRPSVIDVDVVVS